MVRCHQDITLQEDLAAKLAELGDNTMSRQKIRLLLRKLSHTYVVGRQEKDITENHQLKEDNQ